MYATFCPDQMYSRMKIPDDIPNSFEIIARTRMSGTDGQAMAYDTSCFLGKKKRVYQIAKNQRSRRTDQKPIFV